MQSIEPTFRTVSEVPAPVDTVWGRVTTPEGINYELRPYLKMTVPKAFRGRTIGDVSPGTHIGKSLLLLFKLIPIGVDNITITQIGPARMFREESAMTGMRTWIHHRTLEPAGRATLITDTISLEPRLPIPGLKRLLGRILAAFFQHRHRRLTKYFAAN
jgi:ligand-binding SRPBCC domain-containing protein